MAHSTALEQGVDQIVAQCADDHTRLRIVDLGGGTGAQAVRLAAAGHDVTVVDPSADALGIATRRAGENPLSGTFATVQGDAESLDDLLPAASADLVLCHGVLEFVDEPAGALASIHRILRPGGRLSLAVAQRSGAVLLRVVTGQLRQAHSIATGTDGRWGAEDPLRRRFDVSAARTLLQDNDFDLVSVRGLRALSEVAPHNLPEGDATVLDDLDEYAAEQPALAAVAPVLHLHAISR